MQVDRLNKFIPYFLIFIALKNIYLSLPFRYLDFDEAIRDLPAMYASLRVHHILTFMASLALLLLAYNMSRKIRTAWLLTILSLFASISGQLYHFTAGNLGYIILEILVMIYLGLSSKIYSRSSDRISFKRALLYVSVCMFTIVSSTLSNLFFLHRGFKGLEQLGPVLKDVFLTLTFSGNGDFIPTSKIAQYYLEGTIAVFWISVFLSLISLLKPILYYPRLDQIEKNKVRSLVNQYGQNAMSYLTLEDDKVYFFSKEVEGFGAYTTIGDIMVLCGDPIFAENDGFAFMQELTQFAYSNNFSLLFLNTTDRFIDIYRQFGFGVTKSGEEACFDLNEYNLKGGAVAKVRAAINHGVKAGLSVREWLPSTTAGTYDPILAQLQEISDEWLNNKNAPELRFTLGKNNFNSPLDRRYFYCVDTNEKVWAYVVFNPYHSAKGYIAEITRRRSDAPQGTLEMIIYEGFMTFKSEGAIEGTMGLSPLYNINSEDSGGLETRFFSYIYDNMEHYYNFKALHHAKEKYAPTNWQSRYYVYKPKVFTPTMAYAVVRSQLPYSIPRVLLKSLKNIKA